MVFSTVNNKDCECPENTVLESGECVLVRPECESDEFVNWNNVCQECGHGCDECEEGMGLCTKCNDPSYKLFRGHCGCEGEQLDTGFGCNERDEGCLYGTYIKGNMCEVCAVDCWECEDETGYCLDCFDGYIVNDEGQCIVDVGNCNFPYGPEDDPVGCWPYRFSEDRLFPILDAEDEFVDWRDWGVVSPI